MKNAFPTRYLARLFGAIAPEQNTFDAAAALGERLGVPFTFDAASEIASDGSVAARPVLVIKKTGTRIGMLGASIDVFRLPTLSSSGSNMDGFDGFTAEATPLLKLASMHYSFVGSRIALVEEGLLIGLEEDHMEKIRRQLLRTPVGFAGSLFEWDWRIADHGEVVVGGRAEVTNRIAIVRRTHVDFAGAPIAKNGDHLSYSLDVNTAPQNTTPRFTTDQVEEVLTLTRKEHPSMREAVRKLMEGAE